MFTFLHWCIKFNIYRFQKWISSKQFIVLYIILKYRRFSYLFCSIYKTVKFWLFLLGDCAIYKFHFKFLFSCHVRIACNSTFIKFHFRVVNLKSPFSVKTSAPTCFWSYCFCFFAVEFHFFCTRKLSNICGFCLITAKRISCFTSSVALRIFCRLF